MANRATTGKNRPIKMWCWGMRQEKIDIKINVFTGLAAEPCILEKIRIYSGLRCLWGPYTWWNDSKEFCSMDSSKHSDRKILKYRQYRQKVKVFCFFFFTVRVVKHKNEVAQRSCRLSVLEDTQNTSRAGTGQPALAGSAARRKGWTTLSPEVSVTPYLSLFI